MFEGVYNLFYRIKGQTTVHSQFVTAEEVEESLALDLLLDRCDMFYFEGVW